MAFAMLYNRDDLAAMYADYLDARFTGKPKQDLQKYINGGLAVIANPDTVPLAPAEYRNDPASGDPDLRIVVVTFGTKADLAAVLRQAKGTWASRFGGIADDVENNAVEPWPPA